MRILLAITALLALTASACGQVTDKMLWALGQIESGATKYGPCAADKAKGSAGEVGRFQIMPRLLTPDEAAKATNPDVMRAAARRIWGKRIDLYVAKRGSKPDYVAQYELFNAPAHVWNRTKPKAITRDSAERFAALMETK